jgi:hypothetical protein
MNQKKNEEKVGSSPRITVTRYAKKIENFLRKENQPYSELHIAERVFNITLYKEGNIPTSEKDLRELSRIRNALKTLVEKKKIIESLIEDPETKEQVMHYSIVGWYVTP